MKDQIVIVTVCDDHYVVLLAALIRSIVINHTGNERIILYIVEDGLAPDNKQKIQGLTDPEKTQINWLSMTDALPPGIQLPLDHSSYPLNIYARLFIPYFLPAGLEKALYLDVDMLVLHDVSILWQLDISNFYLAAVPDPRIKTVDNAWGGIKNYRDFGLQPQTPYFNTGLLLINLSKWREDDIANRIIALIQANKASANYPDQYGLNVVLANRWLALDPLWNCFASEDMEDPYIIHFISRKPIYKTYNNNPRYYQLFYSYLEKTPWQNSKPLGEGRRYLKKITNIFHKIRSSVFGKAK
ncbi:glycosyltransferase family 8 protein [Pedobacter sp. BS3]|uniref:glycosyltransferase family 8 protein n=1 Tax=Pedobacter sp. BS3 TaxID=2567937 RepID=UPI001F5BFFAD|nr:glycosyltransferase family 8 protein [Pedobacter sp. BS3]